MVITQPVTNHTRVERHQEDVGRNPHYQEAAERTEVLQLSPSQQSDQRKQTKRHFQIAESAD
jgi:hypothetical protein